MGTLSVIVPVYRVEQTLDRCVESILAQTFRNIEIVLVDDGSPDRCPAMCDAWAARDSRIRTIHKANGGLSSARNAALDIVTGDWITFVDSDDWLAPDTYAAVMHQLSLSEAEDVDIAEFPFEHQGSPYRAPVTPGIHRVADNVAQYWLSHRQWEHPNVWNKVFRSTLFCGLRFPDGENHEDIYLLPSLMLRARSIATISCGLYHYTFNPDGICHNPTATDVALAIRNHLRAAQLLSADIDDSWYLALLDMHITLWRLGQRTLLMPSRRVQLSASRDWRQWIKGMSLNVLGLKNCCRLWA